MNYRKFGRLGWMVSEIGHGMWGMGGQWKGSTDNEAESALAKSYELGCNFYDTAWVYGQGHSEQLFRKVLSAKQKAGKIFVATKTPPKNMSWPGKYSDDIQDVFPEDHVIKYTHQSLENLGVDSIDLLLLHVWDDSWTDKDDWRKAINRLKDDGLIKGFGVSVNKWEPENALRLLKTGEVDAIELVYNIFEQKPEDIVLPYCAENNIAVIARVPFDEGALTGKINLDTKFSGDDWRSKFFSPQMLAQSIPRVEKLKETFPDYEMSDLALRFILNNSTVSTVIPGMRSQENVLANIQSAQKPKLNEEVINKLKQFRWDRDPNEFTA